MQVHQVMSTKVKTIRSEASLRDAAAKMQVLDVGFLPVTDDGELVGILTDRDIVLRAIAEGRDPATTSVADCMTDEVITCYEDQDLDYAAELMEESQVRRLIVLNRDEEPIGILSLSDIAAGGDIELTGEILRRICEPAHATR